MNTLSRTIVGSLAAGLLMACCAAPLAAQATTCRLLCGCLLTAQTAADDTPELRRVKCLDLVKRARQAMEDGNLETADSLISRAEAFNVPFGVMSFGDTPKKARHDLEKLRSGQGKSGGFPGKNLLPFGKGKEEKIPTDPFAEERRGSAMNSDPHRTAVGLLAQGRAELARGNVAGATQAYEKAMNTGAAFTGEEEDSPQQLWDDIQKTVAHMAEQPATAPTEQPADRGNTLRLSDSAPVPTALEQSGSTAAPSGDARDHSDKLLLAARQALAVGDVRRATDAVHQAKALNVSYEFHEDSPAKVEDAIGKFQALMERPEAEKSGEGYRRRYAQLELEQAEALIRHHDFNEAERLAQEAQRLGVPFSPFEANPKNVLERVAEARRGGAPKAESHSPASPRNEVAAAPAAAQPDRYASPPAAASPTAAPTNNKAGALSLVKDARAALAGGDVDRAEQLAKQAEAMQVPDSEFGPQDDRPWLVLLQIEKQRRQSVLPAGGTTAGTNSRAVYDANHDSTHNVQAGNEQLQLSRPDSGTSTARVTDRSPTAPAMITSTGMSLFRQAEDALRREDLATAQALYRQADAYRDELDPESAARLQAQLDTLARLPAGGGSNLEDVHAMQQVEFRRLSAEVARQEAAARQLQDTQPDRAREVLEEVRQVVAGASLDTASREALSRRIDRSLGELEHYIQDNQGKIELNARNAAVRSDIEREQRVKIEVQEKLASMVDEFNRLMDEQRYPEAELVAKKANELAPDEPVVLQLRRQAAFVRSYQNNQRLTEEYNDGFVRVQESILASNVPFNDNVPYVHPDATTWKQLTDRRKDREEGRARSEKEILIEQRLKTPVSLQFRDAPLSLVMDNLARLAQVNIHLDQRGLGEEGVTSDTPVTIDLNQEISLKSALHLILEPLHLSYVVKDEVLKITSEQLRDGEVYSVTYYVGDLVSPIPNFVPNGQMGLAGALTDAQRNAPSAWRMKAGSGADAAPLGVVASADGTPSNTMIDPKVLGQFNLPNGAGFNSGGPPQSGTPQNIGFGPGGAGGGVQPDFDSLIELITGTIAPTTWTDVGGAGAVKPFETNLSLVISQTQEVHEEIADLLRQLRRLQDLQVTIEVRFIDLADNFFEQIGVDFDLDVNSRASTAEKVLLGGQNVNNVDLDRNKSNSITVGTGGANNQAPNLFTTDLDIPLSNTSFATAAVPSSFGGPATGATIGGATLGFALLSDLEAYFFMQAVQSDIRTNIMQAPKVTLFNGQQAFVSDTAQSPFVITVIPVVGDFAAAQQPVIVVLSEGTFLTVQAVVSSDRRFVRLTVVPFFSDIGDVDTFTFEGTSTTTRGSSSDGPSGDTTSRNDNETVTQSGTTVQLPTFAFTTVTTTVSVPDGGTVLLGGIKRLSETRRENGVPVLSKLPYINRLFTNIGTGKTTRSLMMMVTPRIIIQEEEEALIGLPPTQ